MKTSFRIEGMTCNGCVETVRSKLLSHSAITDADVSLSEKSALVQHLEPVSMNDLQILLGKQYIISSLPTSNSSGTLQLPIIGQTRESVKIESFGWIKTYKPVLLIFFYLFLLTVALPLSINQFSIMESMRLFMAGFFLVFSFFKFLDLRAFSESYRMYDIVAAKFEKWGYVYVFIELGLGVFFLFNFFPLWSNLLALIVMTVSIVGVLKSVLQNQKIQCACLGTVFNLPMSSITIIEDSLMIVMSFSMLLLMSF